MSAGVHRSRPLRQVLRRREHRVGDQLAHARQAGVDGGPHTLAGDLGASVPAAVCDQAMGDEPIDPGRGRPVRGGGGIEQRREGEEDAGSSGEGAGERSSRVLERARRLGEHPELTSREPRKQMVDRGRAAQRGGQGELAEVPTDHLDPLEPTPHPRRHGVRVDQPQDRILGSDGRHDGPRGERPRRTRWTRSATRRRRGSHG